jgi:hypothetical protein
MDTWLTSRQLTVMMHNVMARCIKEMSLICILNGIYEQYLPPYYTYPVCLTVISYWETLSDQFFLWSPQTSSILSTSDILSDIRYLKELKKTNEKVECCHISNTFSPQLNYLNNKSVCVLLSYLIQCILRYSINFLVAHISIILNSWCTV